MLATKVSMNGTEDYMANSIPNRPEDLPLEAIPYWPDLERWPTPNDVTMFMRRTHAHPGIRLAVLSGLRSFSNSDINPLWSWVGSFIGLLAIAFSMAVPTVWIQIAIPTVVLVIGLLLLGRLASISADMDVRRRRSITWLAAFEDGMTAGNTIGFKISALLRRIRG
jgi:hypothetical protein